MYKRALGCALAVVMLFSLAACGSSDAADAEVDNRVGTPGSSEDLAGQQVDDVVADLEAAGFTSVETVALGDLITGWLHDEGEVDEVKVDGTTEFDAGQRFDPGVIIVVSYHSFPENKDADEESAPKPEETTAPDPSDVPLTPETNAELAALLNGNDGCDDGIVAFAQKYAGQVIAFDGTIGAIANHGSYNTRYDILIVAGDAGGPNPGPGFQYRDVNTTYDLRYVGDNIPDHIGEGDNLRVTARVETFEEQSCLFLLEPVSTEFR